MGFSRIQADVERFVSERDWLEYQDPKNLSMSIAIEAAELMELFQWQKSEPAEKLKANGRLVSRVREEVADVCIYCMSLANRFGFDLDEAIEEKLKRNRERFPIEEVKGKARNYLDD